MGVGCKLALAPVSRGLARYEYNDSNVVKVYGFGQVIRQGYKGHWRRENEGQT